MSNPYESPKIEADATRRRRPTYIVLALPAATIFAVCLVFFGIMGAMSPDSPMSDFARGFIPCCFPLYAVIIISAQFVAVTRNSILATTGMVVIASFFCYGAVADLFIIRRRGLEHVGWRIASDYLAIVCMSYVSISNCFWWNALNKDQDSPDTTEG